MANEKRLIDANDALERLKKAEKQMKVVSVCGCKAVPMAGVIDFVASRPTVDAVEVVRCKDCKHCKKYRNRLDPMLNHQLCVRMDKYAFGVDEDDFCSYGERGTE